MVTSRFAVILFAAIAARLFAQPAIVSPVAQPPIAWTVQFGGPLEDSVDGIALATDGVYIAGQTDLYVPMGSDSYRDESYAQVAKYGNDGKPLWSDKFPTPNVSWLNWASHVAVDNTGVYAIGTILNDAQTQQPVLRKYSADGALQWSQVLLDHGFGADVTAVKGGVLAVESQTSTLFNFTNSGDLVWTAPFPSTGVLGGAMYTDATGTSIYVGRDTVVTPPSGIRFNFMAGVIASFGPSGNLLWSRLCDDLNESHLYGIAADASGVFTVGAIARSGVVYPFLRKYDNNGNIVWTQELNLSGTAFNAVATDGDSVYVAGFTNVALSGQLSAGGYDVFVSKYSSVGALLWTRQFGTAGDDRPNSIRVNSSGIYVGGATTGSFPGFVYGGNIGQTGGSSDGFLVKLNVNPPQLGVVSMSPSSTSTGTPTTFSFTVSDTAGADALQGINILFTDPGDPMTRNPDPYACWLWYDLNRLSVHNNQGIWQNADVVTGGDICGFTPPWISYTKSGNLLTVTLGMIFNYGYPLPAPVNLPVYVRATEGVLDTGYQQVGTVRLNPYSPDAPAFTVEATPAAPRYVAPGTPANYNLEVLSWAGFNDVVQFAATIPQVQPQLSFSPPTVTREGQSTLTVSTGSLPAGVYPIYVTATSSSAGLIQRTLFLAVEDAPPTITVSDTLISGNSHIYGFSLKDKATWSSGQTGINGFNTLIAPSVNGQNACWIFFDGLSLWLASDDASSWFWAGTLSSPNIVQNSQCTIGNTGGTADLSMGWNVTIPVTFSSGFAAAGNPVFVRTSNLAGFDSGYFPAQVTTH